MGVMGVIDFQIVIQARFKAMGRIEIAALEKPPGEDAKPQFYLIKPRAVFGGKVEDMLMRWIAQESAPLHPSAQVLRHTGHLAPLGDQTADRDAPMGIE